MTKDSAPTHKGRGWPVSAQPATPAATAAPRGVWPLAAAAAVGGACLLRIPVAELNPGGQWLVGVLAAVAVLLVGVVGVGR